MSGIYVIHLTQAEAWISEKISVATDESYKDPTNLKAKLQKHQAFEAEITANEERIQALAKVIDWVLHVRYTTYVWYV